MYELKQVGTNSYYIESPAKIGIVRLSKTEVCLIDSGSDKDAGRKVRQVLDASGWHLTAIYNTHSNADHIGGNKFLMAQGSSAEPLTEDALPEGMSMIPLPGHFFDMTGFRDADGVVYLADCLSSRETLEKYRIGFIYDVAAYLNTLEMVKALRAPVFVPAHAEAADDIAPLAQYNIDKVHETAGRILSICETPQIFEAVLQQLFRDYGLTMNFEQYVLVGSTVRSYLSWLRDTGRMEVTFQDGQLLWETAQASLS